MAHRHTPEGLFLWTFGNVVILVIIVGNLTHYSISPFSYINMAGLLIGLLLLNVGILKNRQFYVDNYDEMNPRDIIRNA